MAGAAAGPAPYWPWLAGAAALLAAWAARTLRQSARAAAAVDAAVADTAAALRLTALPDAPAGEEARPPRSTAPETVGAPAPTHGRARRRVTCRGGSGAFERNCSGAFERGGAHRRCPRVPPPQAGDVLAAGGKSPRRTGTGEGASRLQGARA